MGCVMFEQVTDVVRRYDELNDLLSSPEVIKDPEKLRTFARERAELTDLVETYEEYTRLAKELEDTRALLQEDDADLKAMASEEIERLQPAMHADRGASRRRYCCPRILATSAT